MFNRLFKKSKQKDARHTHNIISRGDVSFQESTPNQKLRPRENRDSFQKDSSQSGSHSYQIVSRPYPPQTFLTLYETNSVFYAIVNQIAIDVWANGYQLKLKENGKENLAEKRKIQEFLKRPNPDESLKNLVEKLMTDWGIIGDCAIEVVRNKKNEVAELYTIPSHTVRCHSDKKRFCQERSGKSVWFKKFGLEEDVDINTGLFQDKNILTSDKRANELIFTKNYYPPSDYYGVPNIISAIGSVLTANSIRDYNLSHFDNLGVPSYLIKMRGPWEEGADEKLTRFLDVEVKGEEKKTIVLTMPEEEIDGEVKYGDIEFSKVAEDHTEGGFRQYLATMKEEILVAYSMPPYRIGLTVTGKLGGNIEGGFKTYNESTVTPLQQDLESIINRILEVGLSVRNYEFEFNPLSLEDIKDKTERLLSLMKYGILTPNQVRNELGYPTLEGGDSYVLDSSLESLNAEPKFGGLRKCY